MSDSRWPAEGARQRVTVLGSTGSIGVSTLDVLARHPDRFEVFALAGGTRVEPLLDQCARFRPRFAVMAGAAQSEALHHVLQQNSLPTQVMRTPDAIEIIASHPEVDAVMAAVVGAAGLAPCLAAARAGKRLLLANKEALVMGGEFFLDAVRAGGAKLLPIDSEHSAIFQSLPDDPATWQRRVDQLVLTASGGPFRTRDPATLSQVTPDQACVHPNWTMGRKISVDSATMMNKALEVIEARYLFGFAADRIDVVIHPQSIVHSLVRYHDGSLVAQMGVPDMRVPIAYGLAWPERIDSGAPRLDFGSLSAMTFEEPDHRRFPGLRLAWDALGAPAGTTAVLNASNEIAVQAFLDRRIRFDEIHAVNLSTLDAVSVTAPHTLDDLLALDRAARQAAERAVERFAA